MLEIVNTVSSVMSAYFTMIGVGIAVMMHWGNLRGRLQGKE